MIKSLPALQGAPIQVIHLSGARDERLVADNYQREEIPAHVAAFHHAMEEVYSAADFAIARSGAASLAELAAFSLARDLDSLSLRSGRPPNAKRRDLRPRRCRVILLRSPISRAICSPGIFENSPVIRTKLLHECPRTPPRLAPKNAAALVVETMERYTQSQS